MRVQFSLVGHVERPPDLWADLDTIPREGEVVNWPGISQGNTVVRTVVWYPTHDDEGRPLDEPFVYVVVGQPRDRHGAVERHRDAAEARRSM